MQEVPTHNQSKKKTKNPTEHIRRKIIGWENAEQPPKLKLRF
jgi:hypothetical protein